MRLDLRFLLQSPLLLPGSRSRSPAASPLPTISPPEPLPAPTPRYFDVAILGAGLSGLSAAHHLQAANLSVAVLEARDRVGGRVLNRPLANGGVTELGAAFVGPTQDSILELIGRLGLETFAQHDTGDLLTFSLGRRFRFSGEGGGTGLGPGVDRSVARAIARLDGLAATVDPYVPWRHAKAAKWDSVSFGSWLDGVMGKGPGREYVATGAETIFSARPEEISLLYVLAYVAAAGNVTHKGTWERLAATTGGGQEARVVGGSGLIATRLAERIGADRIMLSSAVRRVTRLPAGGYRVIADGREVLADRVVVAMSPPMAARIVYEPKLPAARDVLMQRMFMGSIGKATAIYERPFWRDQGLRGFVVSDRGMVKVTFDVSPPDGRYGALLGFVETGEARNLDSLSDQEVKKLAGDDYVSYFGAQARAVKEWAIMRWDEEEFSRGGPVAVAGPGTLSEYGPALRKPVGGIHWAGTETAEHWIGYMNGAVESGERVATEILRDRLM